MIVDAAIQSNSPLIYLDTTPWSSDKLFTTKDTTALKLINFLVDF